ncbi:MAG TPA: hypothetical protein VN577_18215 [Terriglobales bacterium]|nr:hypothetical protein [Terriglobales bacterium]
MRIRELSLLCAVVLAAALGFAQTELPDAPSTVAPVPKAKRSYDPYRELLADEPYRPLTKREKLGYWSRRTYSPYTFFSAGVSTTIAGATSDFRYCCGADAWGKQYAAAVADAQTRQFFGNYLFPMILSQDPRYLPKRKGGVLSRAVYAATRVLITRNDDGKSTLNSSELLGVAFSRALSNAYYPYRDRTMRRTGSRICSTLQSDASGYLLKEFMPDIKRIFFRGKLKKLADKLDSDDSEQ